MGEPEEKQHSDMEYALKNNLPTQATARDNLEEEKMGAKDPTRTAMTSETTTTTNDANVTTMTKTTNTEETDTERTCTDVTLTETEP